MNLDGGIHEIPLPPLAQGRLWLCGKHAIGPDPEGLMERVAADGVVCLTEQHELADRYPDYVAWLRSQPPTRALWFPISDLHAPTLEQFAPVLTGLVDRVVTGDRLIVHCAAGIGRAGTVAVAVLVSLSVPLDEALDHVRRHRPAAGPEVGAQLELVRRLHEHLAVADAEADECAIRSGFRHCTRTDRSGSTPDDPAGQLGDRKGGGDAYTCDHGA